MFTVSEKLQNACFQLNHDAYVMQSKRKAKMRQFSPCEKSLILMACDRENGHFGTALITAYMTHCDCHSSLTENELYNMCMDDTARKAHYPKYPVPAH